jgi:hypothetical protein
MFSSNTTQVAAGGGDVNYIESVFSTWLYTGNGSTQTITNGIDLSTKGGLVWFKDRGIAYPHALIDTVRGRTRGLSSNSSDPESNPIPAGYDLSSFNSNGFSLGPPYEYNSTNRNTSNIVSWTFRKQPKFFNVVTWTGDSNSYQIIPHNLGSTPGCVIVKNITTTGDWGVWHRSTGTQNLVLNSTSAAGATYVDKISADATDITVVSPFKTSGESYVAYVFAHNAGGFGLTGSDNVISCGSYTGNGSFPNTITLGYEPQWVMIKKATSPSGINTGWVMFDNMRGMGVVSTAPSPFLYANASDAESSSFSIGVTATGFQVSTQNIVNTSGDTYIYIAIRRGPMKVPTSGTDVFQPTNFLSTGVRQTVGSLSAPDMFISRRRAGVKNWGMSPRLTNQILSTNLTDAETNDVVGFGRDPLFDVQNGYSFISSGSGDDYIGEAFKRAPSFMDVVCYTGTGAFTNQKHNLGVVPELSINKRRNSTGNWIVYTPTLSLQLNSDSAAGSNPFGAVGTSTEFYPASDISGATYVEYLFATCAGVSKVGSYTGTGALQTVNCGFTSGARFVLIKRTDSTGDWYTYDSARGITSGNDPYLLLNSTATEVTGTNYVDTDTTGFKVTAAAPAGLNANGGTYIFLAIA